MRFFWVLVSLMMSFCQKSENSVTQTTGSSLKGGFECQSVTESLKPIQNFFQEIAQKCTVQSTLVGQPMAGGVVECGHESGWKAVWSSVGDEMDHWEWQLTERNQTCVRFQYVSMAHGDHHHIKAVIVGPRENRLVVDMDRGLYILGPHRVSFEQVEKWHHECHQATVAFHSLVTELNPRSIQVTLSSQPYKQNPVSDPDHPHSGSWKLAHSPNSEITQRLWQCQW